jgi:glycosyltransferase involved in cell wall biosynthesis
MSTVVLVNSYPGFMGSQKVMLQVARALAGDGWRPLLLGVPGSHRFRSAAEDAGLEWRDLPLQGGLNQYGGHWLQAGLLARAAFVATDLAPFWARLRRLLVDEKARCVYAANERCWLVSMPAARAAGVPGLWHVQSGLPERGLALHRVAARSARSIVCVSESMRSQVANVLGGNRDTAKLAVIPNGVPDALPTVRIDAAAPAAPAILFAGSLLPHKGAHVLLQAFAESQARAAGWRVQLAGPAPDPAYRAWLEHLVMLYDLHDAVDFLGERDDIPDLMAAAEVVTYPSLERATIEWGEHRWEVDWKEGFGLTAAEAMRAARPVVASDSFGLRDVVLPEHTGILVQPGSTDALRHALDRLAADENLRASMGAAGRHRFRSEFAEPLMMDRFARHFSQLVAA